MSRLLALLLLLTPAAANATAAFPCPQSTIGWALQWPGPITSASYDSDAGVLYIVWNNTQAQAFSNVPIGVMQSLSYTQNPSAIYYGTIIHSFHQILLSEKDNCPLHWEFGGQPYGTYGQGIAPGYVWTN